MLRNYGDATFVYNLEVIEFLEQLTIAQDKEFEQKAWEAWLSIKPNKSFGEFVDSIKNNEPEGVYIDQIGF